MRVIHTFPSGEHLLGPMIALGIMGKLRMAGGQIDVQGVAQVRRYFRPGNLQAEFVTVQRFSIVTHQMGITAQPGVYLGNQSLVTLWIEECERLVENFPAVYVSPASQ